MIEGVDDLPSFWSRVRPMDAEAGGSYFAQARRLPSLLELGLNQSVMRKSDGLS